MYSENIISKIEYYKKEKDSQIEENSTFIKMN